MEIDLNSTTFPPGKYEFIPFLMVTEQNIPAGLLHSFGMNAQNLHQDFLKWVEELAPYNVEKYKHHQTGEDNADAHLKRTIMGREVVAAITKGELDFGPWETIFYGEFDGQRRKRVLIKIIGE